MSTNLFNEQLEYEQIPTKTTASLPDAGVKLKKALGINDFMDLKFHDYEFTGSWLAMFGKPERNFKMLIYGPEKNGKTDFTMKLCKYICQFGKVYYNSHEEGRSKTLQGTLVRNEMCDVAGKVLFLHKESIDELVLRLKKAGSPRFVVIDSVDYMEITEKDYKRLVDTFPKKSFILISWIDKQGNPLTTHAQRIAKRVDIKVFVKDLTAIPVSRFSDETNGNKAWKFGNKTPAPGSQPSLFNHQ
jgi:hypothetical protein